jgi:predicted ester cyclase
MSLDENKALARRFYELHDEGDPALIQEIVAEDAVFHMPDPTSNIVGSCQLPPHIAEARAGFPDVQHHIEDLIAEGDRVTIRLRFQGTHRGEYAGIAPTGKHVAFTAMVILRISGGKAVEGWCDYDALGFMNQLGMELRPKQPG